MNRLQRYIFAEVMSTCLAAVAVFVFVLLAGNALRDVAGMLISGRLSFEAFFRLLVLLLPYAASYALPLGLLCGILISMGRMAGRQEITAMRASGMSLLSIGAPVFLFAIIGSIGAILVHGFYGPSAREQYRELLARYVQENPLAFLQAEEFIDEFPGYVIYIGERDGSQLTDFWIWELDDQDRAIRMLRADTGRIYFNLEEASLILELLQGRGEARLASDPENLANDRVVEVYFEEFPIRLSIEGILNRASPGRSLKRLLLPELIEEWRNLPSLAAETGMDEDALFERRIQIQTLFQENIALGYAVLALALVGFPLAIRTGRQETYANMGLALVLTLIYYTLMISVSWVETFPQLRPDLLIWLPNLIFQTFGIWMLFRMDRV